jgi:hypothetical protein
MSNDDLGAASLPARRGRGRPPLRRKNRLHIDDEIYARLREASQASARSIADEVNARLIMSFAGIDAGQLLADQALERIRQYGIPAEVRAMTEQMLMVVADENVPRVEAAQQVEMFVSMPLGRAIQIGALEILKPGVLDGLANCLGCTRFEATEWWIEILKLVLPYIHERLDDAMAAPPT